MNIKYSLLAIPVLLLATFTFQNLSSIGANLSTEVKKNQNNPLILANARGTCNWELVEPGSGFSPKLRIVCNFPRSLRINTVSSRGSWDIVYQTLPERLSMNIPVRR